jgi:hypothetical protein
MSDLHYFRPDWIHPTSERLVTDICIYGANSAGVAAAIAARRAGKGVVVLQPGKFVGGLTTGGLGWTDYGRKHVIGGISREFYRRLGEKYGKDEEFQFEPSVASLVYSEMLAEQKIGVRLCQYLDRVVTENGRIVAITLLGGLQVSAKVFLDCTYEGDLMAKAGVNYHVGREGNAAYNETLNGVYVGTKHQFSHPVDPYVVEGDPASGLLPGIVAEDLSCKVGQSDRLIQAYNFRMCMTDDPELKIPWAKPAGYDERQYILCGRWLRGEKDKYNDLLPGDGEDPTVPMKFDVLPNKTVNGYHKTDTNNHGAFSSDFIGQNHNWPEASYEERERIFQAHVTYQQGFYWYVANSPDVPDRYRLAFSRWGLPKDEFTQTNHWPHQLYVRESRRMIGAHVITEHDCRGTRISDDPIGMGSYGMDSHNCCRFVKVENGRARVVNEGDVQVPAVAYRVPYRSITPKRSECSNLLVPVCFSASHIAYGSARMEPVFMVLGQSAAIAACLAIDGNVAVQDVKYSKLRHELLEAEQVLGLAPDRRTPEAVS